MRALYHKGDMILVLSCDQINTLRYEMHEVVTRANDAIINHTSLAKAYKDPKLKRLHRNAKARAITRHKQLKQLAEELEAVVKEAFHR